MNTEQKTDRAGCLFCKIVRGELPSYKVYENDRVMAFLDIYPVNAGHTLVVPKKHSANIFDITAEDWAAVAEAVRILSRIVEHAVNADGVNIAMNNREHAGQIIHHPHVHIIPRFKNDGLKLMPQRKYLTGEAERIGEKIKETLA